MPRKPWPGRGAHTSISLSTVYFVQGAGVKASSVSPREGVGQTEVGKEKREGKEGEEEGEDRGGQLRLRLPNGVDAVDVEPRDGTLVVFDSAWIEHQFLPVYDEDQYMMHAWFSGPPVYRGVKSTSGT